MYRYFYSTIFLRLWSLHAYFNYLYPSTWLDRERESNRSRDFQQIKLCIENVSGYSHNPCSLNRERDTALNASGTPSAWPSLSPYRITPIHWLMARRRLWRNDVVRSYWRTRHPLLRFLCRKEPCRQRVELGSKRSVSFPIQRTRVTRVTRDVLFHR